MKEGRRGHRLRMAATLALVTLAACRGILGIDDAPGDGPPVDGAGKDAAGNTQPVDPTADGAARRDSAQSADGGGDGTAPQRDGGFDGATREVNLRYPAYPLPPATPPVASYTLTADTVFDHTTGLEWQRTIASPKDLLQPVIDYCTTLSLGGKTDWRVPSRNDLLTLLDLNATQGPTIQTAVFKDNAAEALWSLSITTMPNMNFAHTVNFANRSLIWYGRNYDKLRTRCVRGTEQAAKNPPHWALTTDEALDLDTSLVWQRVPHPKYPTFADALLYCQSLDINGKKGFRVPSQRELASIIDETASSYGIDQSIFDVGPTFRYWTTTESLTNPGEKTTIDVGYGGSSFHLPPGDMAGVRCVRDL